MPVFHPATNISGSTDRLYNGESVYVSDRSYRMSRRISGILGGLVAASLAIGATVVVLTTTITGYRGATTLAVLLFVGLLLSVVVVFSLRRERSSTPYW
jgi:hypothetical protein